MDLFILGPTSTGKTLLANYFAGLFNFPIFNCDSVQVYNNLNKLTNKPKFKDKCFQNNEIIAYTIFEEIKVDAYQDFTFYFGIFIDNKFNYLTELSINDLLQQVFNIFCLTQHKQKNNNKKLLIQNFLFDIKEPFDSYSSFDFHNDLSRINNKFNFPNRIICGGTIYYAYNYLFNLHNENESEEFLDTANIKKYKELPYDTLYSKVKNHRDKILGNFDFSNKITLAKLAYLIDNHYDLNRFYFKPKVIKNDFLIIFIFPKNRQSYYQNLDEKIENKLNNKDSFEELNYLTTLYGYNIIDWLSNLSYEYKYFFQLLTLKLNNAEQSNSSEYNKIKQTLKYKEHQYAKRQLTFIKKFIKELNMYFLANNPAKN